MSRFFRLFPLIFIVVLNHCNYLTDNKQMPHSLGCIKDMRDLTDERSFPKRPRYWEVVIE